MARAYPGMAGIARVTDRTIRSALATVDTYLRDNSRAMSPTNDPTSVSVGSAPDDVAFVTIGAESRLSAERRLIASSPLVLTDGGANGAATLSLTTATLAASLTAVPNLAFSTGAATGSATTFVQTDATIPLFDATVPAALAGTAATGSAAFAARRDHVHLFPTTLRSTANAATLALTDDGTNQTLTGSLGNLIFVPTGHVLLSNTTDADTRRVGVGEISSTISKFQVRMATTSSNRAALNFVTDCNASSININAIIGTLATSAGSGVGNASNMRAISPNFLVRGVNKTVASCDGLRVVTTLSSDDATTILTALRGVNISAPVRAGTGTIGSMWGLVMDAAPSWVTNAWTVQGQNKIECGASDFIASTNAKGFITKDSQGTPRYWRIYVDATGATAGDATLSIDAAGAVTAVRAGGATGQIDIHIVDVGTAAPLT